MRNKLSGGIVRRLKGAWSCFRRYSTVVYDLPGVCLRLKVWMLKIEAVETLLFGCVTWSLSKAHYDNLRRVHHSLLRLDLWKRMRDDHTLSYGRCPCKTGPESIEATVGRQQMLLVGDSDLQCAHRGCTEAKQVWACRVRIGEGRTAWL